MFKVMRTKVMISTLFAMILALNANAQMGRHGMGARNNANPKPAYIDKNNNNVCDNYESRIDTNNNSKWGNQTATSNRRNNRGPNFVDKNNNGICDYRENATTKN